MVVCVLSESGERVRGKIRVSYMIERLGVECVGNCGFLDVFDQE